jgi:hypothetical protein
MELLLRLTVSVPSCSFGQTPIWPLFFANVRIAGGCRKIVNRISRFLSGKSGRDCKSRASICFVRLDRDETTSPGCEHALPAALKCVAGLWKLAEK